MEQFNNQPKPEQEKSDAELEREIVIEHNLTMMNEDMQKLLGTESIGGGMTEIDGKMHSCSVANGYAKPENGEIVMFQNSQYIKDRAIIEENNKFALVVAMDLPERMKTDTFRGFFKITKMMADTKKNPLSPEAMANMKASIQRWNAEHENWDRKRRNAGKKK